MIKSVNNPFGTEIHQLDWIPGLIKERQLEGILPILKSVKFDRKLLALFERLRGKTGAKEFLDLGSGVGNVVEFLAGKSADSVRFLMSDLSPRLNSYQLIKERNSGRIDFVPYSVDLCQADGVLKGRVATIITTFHELDKKNGRKVVANLLKHSEGFLIAEPMNRSLGQLAKLPLIALSCLFFPLWVKPKRLSHFLFTWMIPILPLCHMHDGVISLLRSYSKSDFQEMLQEEKISGWQWEVGNMGLDTTYVLAWRKSEP